MTDADIAALAILLGDAPEEYDDRCAHCHQELPHNAEQHAASVAAYISQVREEHQTAAGAKCH